MKLVKVFFALTMAFSCIALLGFKRAHAQGGVIELRYATPYAPNHPYSIADQEWIKAIEKETKGAVKIKPYWAGTLISSREATKELIAGVADIAFITPMYERTGFTISKILVDFFFGGEPTKNIRAYWEVFNKFEQLRKEFEGVKILALCANYPMHLMTTKKPVTSLSDLKGLRIRITGDVMVKTMKNLGVEPVSMPVAEAYEALGKGIIDGVILGGGDYQAFKLVDVIKFATINFQQYRGVYPSRAINMTAWKKLPPEVQRVFDQYVDFWTSESTRLLAQLEEEGLELARKTGIKFIQMPAADLEIYKAEFHKALEEEISRLEKEGIPVRAIYTEIRKLLAMP
ncbi:MAG: TRAP transporter substrate-binding protein DctP [Candidatus Bathyarchaeia archaeon]